MAGTTEDAFREIMSAFVMPKADLDCRDGVFVFGEGSKWKHVVCLSQEDEVTGDKGNRLIVPGWIIGTIGNGRKDKL